MSLIGAREGSRELNAHADNAGIAGEFIDDAPDAARAGRMRARRPYHHGPDDIENIHVFYSLWQLNFGDSAASYSVPQRVKLFFQKNFPDKKTAPVARSCS